MSRLHHHYDDLIEIRYATPEDAEDIHEITHDAFGIYAQSLGQPDKVAALKETPEDVVRDIGKKHVIIGTFVSKPAGSIRFDILPGNIAYISRFGVRPEFQKYGMGKALIQFVHARCRELGLNAIVLHTGAKVFQLVRFYYGMGYYVHSTTTDRGYIRAFLVHELQPEYDLSAAMEK